MLSASYQPPHLCSSNIDEKSSKGSDEKRFVKTKKNSIDFTICLHHINFRYSSKIKDKRGHDESQREPQNPLQACKNGEKRRTVT
jgi:hypothetical protein